MEAEAKHKYEKDQGLSYWPADTVLLLNWDTTAMKKWLEKGS